MSFLKIDGSLFVHSWINDPREIENHQHSLDRYFGIGNNDEVFQGRNFEWFVSNSNSELFTAFDFLAIGSLSVEIPAESQRMLLEDSGSNYASLLRECMNYVQLNHAAEDLTWVWKTGNPLEALYLKLRSVNGIGPVVCSKLMAAKFPTIIPIRDSKVEELLRSEKSVTWWEPMLELFASVEETLSHLETGHVNLTNLRKLDVILWMEAKNRGL